MITKLNNYEINTLISGYDDLSLFSKLSYNLFASFGIKRKFKGEEFYHVKNNILLGETCSNACVAAINGIIYKIYFRHSVYSLGKCKPFRDELREYIVHNMGRKFDKMKLREGHVSIKWEGINGEGNVVFEAINFYTAIIITSSNISNAKKLGAFEKLFNSEKGYK